VLRLDCGFSD